jgi:hypothetical protein
MSRQLKRVPMDFDWPLNKVWDGFINPHYKKCPDCKEGSTTAGEMLAAIAHLIMIAGDSAARGKLHPYLESVATRLFTSVSSDMTELSTGLAGRSPSGLGHDSCDRWSAVAKIKKAAGVSDEWGTCPTCKGRAIDLGVLAAYEAWTPSEPPTGEGYQLWEDCSEGSPISPVFKSLDALCQWAATNATTFGSYRASASEWRSMLDS